jgi:hypothetical protein
MGRIGISSALEKQNTYSYNLFKGVAVTMLKDRGSKKWQGFFLPEHKKMLKQMEIDLQKTERPSLDEGQLEEMERLISESFQQQTLLEFTTWKDGFFTSRVGTVVKVDPLQKKIQIQD